MVKCMKKGGKAGKMKKDEPVKLKAGGAAKSRAEYPMTKPVPTKKK